MHLSRYLKAYPSQDRPGHYLLFSTLRLSKVLVPADTLERARTGELTDPERETLARLGMLVPDPSLEREQVRGFLERVKERSRTYKVMVVLNLDCNLECGYCYEGEFRGGHYMSAATADLLVETLLRERVEQGWDLTLSFYGGEPLLSLDLIRRISEPLLAAARREGTKYGFSLVTNGTLLNRETAHALLPLGLQTAKFTLDGPREIHDVQRPYASGAGSFDSIVDNIAEVWDLFPIQLGSNFLQENYREFPKLLDQLVARGITPDRLSMVQFTPVTPKAGCAEHGSGCASSSAPWLVDALMYLREETLSRGFRTSRPSVSACVVELDDNIVVTCEGTLYKCPAFMGDKAMSVGTLSEGIRDYSASHCIGNWQTDLCLDCPYLPLCFGGCRFLTVLQGKGMEEVDCKSDFLDATLERTLLQDMAHLPRPAAG